MWVGALDVDPDPSSCLPLGRALQRSNGSGDLCVALALGLYPLSKPTRGEALRQ